MLEAEEMATARGATIYGELAGFGATGDAHHITAPRPDGAGAVDALEMALSDAKLNKEDVGYINAHGTSTPANDVMETRAIKAVFGEHARSLAVSSTKSMTGHLLGAAAAVEAIYSLMAIREGVLPPTMNHFESDPECDLDYVANEARQVKVSPLFPIVSASVVPTPLSPFGRTRMTWGAGRRLVLASDHAAVELRCLLAKAATLWGFEVEDLGPSTTDSIDYPVQAKRLADRLAQDGEAMGVLVCGTGIGMSMVANRFSHLRAAAVSDDFTAQATRAHNDANVLCLGSRTSRTRPRRAVAQDFLIDSFEGGRHQRRGFVSKRCIHKGHQSMTSAYAVSSLGLTERILSLRQRFVLRCSGSKRESNSSPVKNTSPAVLEATGSVFTNKYAEGYPPSLPWRLCPC